MAIKECIDENKGIEGRSEKTQTLQYTASIMTLIKKYDQFTKVKYILETSCKRSLSSVDHPESNNNRNAKKLRKSSHCHITETGKLD